ncbi:MAG: hypothetical protein HOO06_09200 [Bdellovibrionaceae bacterium]|nr:hypothetical protein [Pseudobdellovibrionaceae bacterium]
MYIFLINLCFLTVSSFATTSTSTSQLSTHLKNEQNLKTFTTDFSRSLLSYSSTGEEEQDFSIDAQLISIHGIGLLIGYDTNLSSKNQFWGLSFGIGTPLDTSKKIQNFLKYKMFGFKVRPVGGDLFFGLELGTRLKMNHGSAIYASAGVDLFKRGYPDKLDKKDELGIISKLKIGVSFGL